MDQYKKLQDEAAEIANRIEAVAATTGDADTIAERDLQLEDLVKKSKTVATKLSFEADVLESAKHLRQIVDRCTPAPEVAVEKTRIEAVPFSGKLRAFKNPADAYAMGQWIKSKFTGDVEARSWCMDHGIESRAMGEATNGLGGATVPVEFTNIIIRNVEEFSVWPGAMQNLTMGSDTAQATKRLTGVTAAWGSENTEISTSDPTMGTVSLVAKKLVVGTKVSNELLSDSAISIGDFIASEFSTAIADKLDAAAVNGDGTSTYGGIHGISPKLLTVAGGFSQAAAGNDTFAELTVNDFYSVIAKLPRYAYNGGGSAWYISPQGFAASMQRLDAAAGGRMSFDSALGFQFLGFPVVLTTSLPTTLSAQASALVCILGNASLAGIYGVRSSFAVRTSTERFVEIDQTLFTGTARADMVWHSFGTATESGPLVGLKMAA